ncbi:BA14K family protein [Xanthobacteraceae bacterium Astr-EGSB]|uniref:BA14K family protein n=1 Tax=Astrobacterium formosum TaxID=3069710 RepID=UPI0027B1DA87|nr:BA14K family protein [Xanthobacteraceae bacterium Astr-EGSB]
MKTKITAGVMAMALAIGTIAVSAGDAEAQRWRHHHNRHGGWGWGAGAGFAAGALLGGALASRPYYGSGYYSGEPYAAVPGPSPSDVDYCSRRFKSYDPASGTYLGYDGNRHPCP